MLFCLFCTLQLEMVISLLGSPQSLEDFLGVPDWARRYLMQKMTSSNYKRSFLSSVLPTADAPVVHLLTRLLAVSPVSIFIQQLEHRTRTSAIVLKYEHHSTISVKLTGVLDLTSNIQSSYNSTV